MNRKIAAGNWKMNGLASDLAEIDARLRIMGDPDCEVLICPPATLVHRLQARAADSVLRIGAQDCHPDAKGAHTGDLSTAMLVYAGASHVNLGHSERRADHGERDAQVRAKASAAMAEGLVGVVCIGESEAEHDAGRTLEVVGEQLRWSLPEDSGGTLVGGVSRKVENCPRIASALSAAAA